MSASEEFVVVRGQILQREFKRKVLCVVWAPGSSRMDEISEALGTRVVYLTILYGHRYLAPIRYLALFILTGYLLLKEKPDVVYAQNPPIFCPLSCIPYCKIWRKVLIVDHHAVWSVKSFAKGGLLWKLIGSLERFVVLRTFANTTPHRIWERKIKEMGASKVLTLYDYVTKNKFERSSSLRARYLRQDEKGKSPKKFLVLAPHGGHPLERVESEVDASAQLDEVLLIISGPPSKLERRIRELDLPSNVDFLGFLPKEEYQMLEASIDLGLNITDEPFTVSHCLLEFAASSVPAVSSPQEAVRELFGDSLLYVETSKPEDVKRSLSTVLRNPAMLSDYGERIQRKHEEFTAQRVKSVDELRRLVFAQSNSQRQ